MMPGGISGGLAAAVPSIANRMEFILIMTRLKVSLTSLTPLFQTHFQHNAKVKPTLQDIM